LNSVSDLDFLSIPADRKRKYMQHSEQYTNKNIPRTKENPA